MSLVQIVGYLASALVLAAFSMKAMTPLRIVAIGSNVAFISYAYLGGLTPILLLHLVLLPINLWRLHETLRSPGKPAHRGRPIDEVRGSRRAG